jgi:hypothetical protein
MGEKGCQSLGLRIQTVPGQMIGTLYIRVPRPLKIIAYVWFAPVCCLVQHTQWRYRHYNR